jgi:hypothetical protein
MPTIIFGLLVLALALWVLGVIAKVDPKIAARVLKASGRSITKLPHPFWCNSCTSVLKSMLEPKFARPLIFTQAVFSSTNTIIFAGEASLIGHEILYLIFQFTPPPGVDFPSRRQSAPEPAE